MTLVNIHGILAAEFKNCFSLAIKKPKEVFEAIACNYPKFKFRIAELAQQGIHYTLVIDGERIQDINEVNINRSPSTIDIVPLICGAGKAGVAIAIIAVGVLTAGVGAYFGMAALAAGGTMSAGASLAISAGIAMAGMGLQMMLAPKPDMQRAESTVSAAKQSFNFGSKANVTEQGIPVPVGYGRLRIGSAVIQSTIKSYPSSYNIDNALSSSSNGEQSSSSNNNK